MARSTKLKLSTRFSMLIIASIVAASAIYIPWCIDRQQSFSEDKALAEARTLNQEMNAAWDYINAIQNQINYDADGRYDFKNVYCSIAGKAIAQRFMLESDYDISYVRENPRSITDDPDAFERTALGSFEDAETLEYYDTSVVDGKAVFRYVSALHYDSNCMSCHGEPIGEQDETGFLKEGMAIGDLAGAASITIPMELYQDEIVRNAITDIFFFLLLILLIVTVIRLALTFWIVKPLERLGAAADRIGEGAWSTSCVEPDAPREIEMLADSFEVMARQLKASYESLEEKVSLRTAALSEANDQLERQRQRLKQEVAYKSNFLSIMSHELKTPIASITAAMEIWRKSKPTSDDEDLAFIDDLKLQCTSLLGTIDNALDTSRIESGRFEPHMQQIDLVDVIDAVEESVEPIAKRKSISLNRSIDPSVPIIESDWDSLQKIVVNIASNAVKFTSEGGTIRFEAVYREGDDRVIVSVKDTGIGIAQSDQTRVFDRFVQLDSSLSREYHGSGLGLSLAQDLAHQIGADLHLESELGVGSTFSVSIPVHNASGKRQEDGE